MSFLTAVLDAAGGYAKGKQQAFQNQYETQQLDLQKQQEADARANADVQRQIEEGQLQDQQTQRQHLASNQAFEAKLKLPPNFDRMTPDQQTAYLRVRQNAAYAAGDYEFAQEVQKQIDGLYGLTKAGIAAQSRLTNEQILAQMWAARNAANEQIGAGHDTAHIQYGENLNDTNLQRESLHDATTLAGIQLRDANALKIQQIRSTGTKVATDVGSKYLGTEISKYNTANAVAQKAGKPLPYPGLDYYSQITNGAIAHIAQHPEDLDKVIQRVEAMPETGDQSMTKDMKASAITALSQTAAQAKAQQAQAEALQKANQGIDSQLNAGGSNANGNPPAWFH